VSFIDLAQRVADGSDTAAVLDEMDHKTKTKPEIATPPNSTPASAVLDELVLMFGGMHMGPFTFVSINGVGVTFEFNRSIDVEKGKGIHIGFIGVAPKDRRKGIATKALKALTSLADKHGVFLDLEVDPRPMRDDGKKAPVGVRDLTAFYKKHGFKNVGHRSMERKPLS
jgi:ribosomal protein S18 acetylase RimI-like enzyme